MTKSTIKAWAEKNYDESHFAQTIIECWDDEDYAEAPADMKGLIELKVAIDDHHDDICSTAW